MQPGSRLGLQERTSSAKPVRSQKCHQQTWQSTADHILEMSLTGRSRRFDRAPNISVCRLSLDLSHSCSNGVGRRTCRTFQDKLRGHSTMGFSGGCSCGAVRYTISAEPIRGFQCQCRDCQIDSGGGHSSVLVFSRATFEISGEVREIARTSDRGATKRKGFCPNCGVSVYNKPDRVPNSSASMSEASTVPCLSSPPSSSTPRAAMPGIFWTLTFPSCRSGIRTRNSNRAIRKKRPVRVNRVILVVGQLLPVFPCKRTSSGPVADVSKVPKAEVAAARRSVPHSGLPARS